MVLVMVDMCALCSVLNAREVKLTADWMPMFYRIPPHILDRISFTVLRYPCMYLCSVDYTIRHFTPILRTYLLLS